MGCGASAAPSEKKTQAADAPLGTEAPTEAPVGTETEPAAAPEPATEPAAAPEPANLDLEALGVETPRIPGDVTCCGKLTQEAQVALAPRFKSWLNLNSLEDFFPEDVKKAGVEHVKVCPFPGPPGMPSEEQVTMALEALDRLPRPMMLQCSSGNRVGVALLLWLARKQGKSPESATLLAEDDDLRFWNRCAKCGPMKEWVLKQLPAFDAGSMLKPTVPGQPIFSQLFNPETSSFTYLLGCDVTKECVLIDPVFEQKDRDLAVVSELGLTLRHVLHTHCHADHVTSAGIIKKELPEVRSVISKASGAQADVLVDPGDKIALGGFELEAIATPGHTDGCVTWSLPGSPGRVFTGDALLIRSCGRTDLQQGDSATLYDSVHTKIFSLPGETVVYPGHDFSGRNHSTVEEERLFNARFTKSKDEFVTLMAELNLPHPDNMDVVLPANLAGGVRDE